MKLNNLTFGADPELFIVNTKTKKVVSAVGLIPGEKGNPWRSEDMPEGFGLETDNILAEFNIPPVKDGISFINNIQYMQNYIDRFVKAINPDLGIHCAASQVVPTSELQSEQARMFGCDVDYNAYTQEPNEKPCGETTNIRSAGMHIHLGYENPDIDTSLTLIKYLDAYLGVPSILKDKDKKRRSLYGKAGCFRLTDYGCEYRVLSSAMMNSTARLDFVWKQLTKAITAAKREILLPSSIDIQEVINNSDIKLAESLISSFKLV